MPRNVITPERLAEVIRAYYGEHKKSVTVTQLCYLLDSSETVVRRSLKECGGVPDGIEKVKTTVPVFDEGTGWKRWASGFKPKGE